MIKLSAVIKSYDGTHMVQKSNVRLVDQSSLKIGLSILSKLIRHLDGGLQYSANCFSRSASFALGHFCCFG